MKNFKNILKATLLVMILTGCDTNSYTEDDQLINMNLSGSTLDGSDLDNNLDTDESIGDTGEDDKEVEDRKGKGD